MVRCLCPLAGSSGQSTRAGAFAARPRARGLELTARAPCRNGRKELTHAFARAGSTQNPSNSRQGVSARCNVSASDASLSQGGWRWKCPSLQCVEPLGADASQAAGRPAAGHFAAAAGSRGPPRSLRRVRHPPKASAGSPDRQAVLPPFRARAPNCLWQGGSILARTVDRARAGAGRAARVH